MDFLKMKYEELEYIFFEETMVDFNPSQAEPPLKTSREAQASKKTSCYEIGRSILRALGICFVFEATMRCLSNRKVYVSKSSQHVESVAQGVLNPKRVVKRASKLEEEIKNLPDLTDETNCKYLSCIIDIILLIKKNKRPEEVKKVINQFADRLIANAPSPQAIALVVKLLTLPLDDFKFLDTIVEKTETFYDSSVENATGTEGNISPLHAPMNDFYLTLIMHITRASRDKNPQDSKNWLKRNQEIAYASMDIPKPS